MRLKPFHQTIGPRLFSATLRTSRMKRSPSSCRRRLEQFALEYIVEEQCLRVGLQSTLRNEDIHGNHHDESSGKRAGVKAMSDWKKESRISYAFALVLVAVGIILVVLAVAGPLSSWLS